MMADVLSPKSHPLSTPIPLWLGLVALVVGWGALAAVIVGLVGPDSDEVDPGQRHTGVVTTVDLSEDGSVCIARPNGEDNECYRSPGLGLQVGDQVRYSLQDVSLGEGMGTQRVLVYAEVESD